MSRYQDVNPVPTSPLVDVLATVPLGPVWNVLFYCCHSFTPTLRENPIHCFVSSEGSFKSTLATKRTVHITTIDIAVMEHCLEWEKVDADKTKHYIIVSTVQAKLDPT